MRRDGNTATRRRRDAETPGRGNAETSFSRHPAGMRPCVAAAQPPFCTGRHRISRDFASPRPSRPATWPHAPRGAFAANVPRGTSAPAGRISSMFRPGRVDGGCADSCRPAPACAQLRLSVAKKRNIAPVARSFSRLRRRIAGKRPNIRRADGVLHPAARACGGPGVSASAPLSPAVSVSCSGPLWPTHTPPPGPCRGERDAVLFVVCP